jgi:hypothetical protein
VQLCAQYIGIESVSGLLPHWRWYDILAEPLVMRDRTVRLPTAQWLGPRGCISLPSGALRSDTFRLRHVSQSAHHFFLAFAAVVGRS